MLLRAEGIEKDEGRYFWSSFEHPTVRKIRKLVEKGAHKEEKTERSSKSKGKKKKASAKTTKKGGSKKKARSKK